MGWSCEACTFLNVEDSVSKCQICETVRSEAAELIGSYKRPSKGEGKVSLGEGGIDQRKRPSEHQQKSTLQATLFGGIAPKPQKEKSKSKKPKVDTETTKQSTLSFASKHPPTTTSDIGSSGLALWKECASKDIPFSDLKDRTRIAMKNIFGVERLRLLQPKAVSCALKRRNQLVVMATGGGT
jgi:hypothetical protein